MAITPPEFTPAGQSLFRIEETDGFQVLPAAVR
jgi:hypothetical protein